MQVSVAIVNWNTRDLLHECLMSLVSSTVLYSSPIEVIVVDNGSTDGSADMVSNIFPEVNLIRNHENLGFSKAINQAFSISRGQYFLMFNSDASMKETNLHECTKYLDENSNIAVLGCRLENTDGSTQSSCFRFTSLFGTLMTAFYLSQMFRKSYVLNWDRYGCTEWKEPTEVDCVMGSFMMVKRSVIGSGELLDSSYFMYGEEKDLCFRLKAQGYKTVFFPGATVVHHHFGSSSDPSIGAWVYEMKRRAKLRFLYKWRGSVVAWCANGIMTVELLPRIVAWTIGDLIALARGKGAFPERLLRLRVLRFHLGALANPSRMMNRWGPHS